MPFLPITFSDFQKECQVNPYFYRKDGQVNGYPMDMLMICENNEPSKVLAFSKDIMSRECRPGTQNRPESNADCLNRLQAMSAVTFKIPKRIM